jgi:hypothetical protein
MYEANTPDRFWQFDKDISAAQWLAAAEDAAAELPQSAAEVLRRGGLNGLTEFVLGEEQFGPDRYRLSTPRTIYYTLRPVLPRSATSLVRRHVLGRARQEFRLGWPVEDRYVRFLHGVGQRVCPEWAHDYPQRGNLWPDGADYAFVLTHDVERAAGQAFVPTLADIDEKYGFRSSFNFVMEDYPLDTNLLQDLTRRGFEVGIHGIKHDGSLFSSRARFTRDSPRIKDYARRLGARGFRSPATHRNPAWMQDLEVDYDASFFDTDPYEVMPGGTMTIWPFFCGRLVELPYTLPQDHTLFVVLGERSPRVWLDKTDFVAKWNGMALLIAHPDYLESAVHLGVYEEFLAEMQRRRRRSDSGPVMWHALPREVAEWWRQRATGARSPRLASASNKGTS